MHCSPGLGVARYLPDGSTSSFGDGGRVVTGENDFSGVFVFGVSDMARQRDGKLVVVASGNGRGVVIARYTKSGMLDPGFGDGGVVVDPVPDCACVPWGYGNGGLAPGPSGDLGGLALQRDGRVAPWADPSTAKSVAFTLARYR